MRERDRKSIEIDKMLPQFTTMNVIEGQAGLVNYSSLIFYSLTLNNILNIIVLLILAGVSIATLTGPNGLLTRANEAKQATTEAGAREKLQMEVAGSFDNNGNFNMQRLKDNLKNNLGLQDSDITDNGDGSIKVTIDGYEMSIWENGDILKKANLGEVMTGGNGIYTDETGTAIIPQGFAVVTDPDTIINGLVISDKANDNMNNDAQGNQFVWVPVSKDNFETEFVRHNFGIQNISDSDFINTEPTSGMYYEPTPGNTNGTTATTKAEIIAMYDSVKTNGGFYIARFEAGNEGGTYNTETNQWEGNGKVVSKKGATVYNNIPWNNDGSMITETEGAVEKARGMYPGHSTLIYGVQWDAVMRWISNDSALSGYLTNSTGKGNYGTTAPIATGSNSAYQMKNIYDMAGNVWEWTMEAYYTNHRVLRGSNFSGTGSDNPVPCRGSDSPDISYPTFGFRPALYV